MNLNTLSNISLGLQSYLPSILPVTKPDGQVVGVPVPGYVYSTAKLYAKNAWDNRIPQIIVSDDNHYYNAKFNYFIKNNKKLIGINMIPVNDVKPYSHIPLIVAQKNTLKNGIMFD
mgnify:CR=1 FL=1|tara:strand:- start:61 stop:408 length:348 start_codon:yes stop_codon:yes gene_type:complete